MNVHIDDPKVLGVLEVLFEIEGRITTVHPGQRIDGVAMSLDECVAPPALHISPRKSTGLPC